jgi:bifunctional non-homologous end joining protein LigD
MLLRPGAIPAGDGWAFEVKYDGFRAIVANGDTLRVRSRRGWSMADRVPELRQLPGGLILDGELVAFNEQGEPDWPRLCERVLHGNTSIPVTLVVFDLLAVDGHDVMCNPWEQRRALLDQLWVDSPVARLADVFDDGHALFNAIVAHGVEGIVAKRRTGLYRPGYSPSARLRPVSGGRVPMIASKRARSWYCGFSRSRAAASNASRRSPIRIRDANEVEYVSPIN